MQNLSVFKLIKTTKQCSKDPSEFSGWKNWSIFNGGLNLQIWGKIDSMKEVDYVDKYSSESPPTNTPLHTLQLVVYLLNTKICQD